MAHFIFSVAVVLLWLVAWGIYLVFVKNLKRKMEEIENSDPNQNNLFITATMGIGGAAISIFFPNTKPIVDGVKPLAEKGLQEAFRKDKLTEGQKKLISSLRFLSLFFIVVSSSDRLVSHLEFQRVVFLESNRFVSSLCGCLFRSNITKYIYC